MQDKDRLLSIVIQAEYSRMLDLLLLQIAKDPNYDQFSSSQIILALFAAKDDVTYENLKQYFENARVLK